MTEPEWLASEDPQAMLGSLEREWDKGGTYYVVSDRKLRLFACACALTAFDDLSLPSRVDWGRWVDSPRLDEMTAVEGAAYWCGQKVGQQLLKQVRAALLRDIVGNPFRPQRPLREACAACGGKGGRSVMGWQPQISSTACGSSWLICRECHGRKERVASWITPQALSLSQTAYDERQDDGTLDPARLTILADCLEEAGHPPSHSAGLVSQASNLLDHLRSPALHVRGCWALDLVLGKE